MQFNLNKIMNNHILLMGSIGLFLFAMSTRAAWATPPHGMAFDRYFKKAERQYALPPGLLSRMALQESGYQVNARGASGEIGIMQITPRWHPGVDPTDPEQSIYYAGYLMRKYYNDFGSWSEAIAAYNWGETNVRNKGIEQAPEITRRYIRDVLGDIGA